MNISIITASYPLDEQTHEEINGLLQIAYETDGKRYEEVLKYALMPQYNVNGFVVIAYDDTTDNVIAVASAADIIGFNTFEWSVLVAPMYRSLGVGTHLVNILQDGLKERNCEGELVLATRSDGRERQFLARFSYHYSFSEAVLEAPAMTAMPNYDIRPYCNEQLAVTQLYEEAFGDLPDEAMELIEHSTTANGTILWVAYDNNEVVGTMTTIREGSVQWVTALATKKTARGKGVATALLAWAKHFTLDQGGTKVNIEVEMDNEAALNVYTRNHFLVVQQTDYYVRALVKEELTI